MTKPAIDISAGLKPRAGKSAPEEPNTGRDVLHTPIHAARIQAEATEDHPHAKKVLTAAISSVPGTKLHGARDAKPEGRLRQKVDDERQPPRTVPDYSAFRVAVDSREAKDNAVGAIRGKFKVIREKDEFDRGAPDTGFHAHMLQVQRPGSGVSHEVQVLPKTVADTAENSHDLYEKARSGDAGAAAEMKGKNEAAWKQFQGGETNPQKPETKPTTGETKYKSGTTQANLPKGSEAAAAIAKMARSIPAHHLAGDGKDVDEPHVTVRYGLKDANRDKLRQFIRSQRPFTAKLGKTGAFPPSEHSDGAAPIHAPVESPELHRLNAEIEKHGDFEQSSFPDYKPHVTVAYVKPEVAQRYVGNGTTAGKQFRVSSIAIGDRDGNKEVVPMQGTQPRFGTQSNSERKGGRGESAPEGGVEQAAGVASNGAPVASNGSEVPALPKIATGSSVALADGRAGIVKWIMGGKIRIQTPEGGRVDAKLTDATPIPPLEKTGGNWDGVDVDGTLAHYDGFKGATIIGPPVQAMVDHVKEWLAAGQDVRIFTARISHDPTGGARKAVQAWSLKYLGRVLPVTDKKDSRMRVMYDDRAVQVSRNRGELLGDPKAAASDGTAKVDFSAGLKKRA